MKPRRGRSRKTTVSKSAPSCEEQSDIANDEKRMGGRSASIPEQEDLNGSSACEQGPAAGIVRHVIDGVVIEEYIQPMPITVQGEPDIPPVENSSAWSLVSEPAAVLGEGTSYEPPAIAGRVSTTPEVLMPPVNMANAGNKLCHGSVSAGPSRKSVRLPTTAAYAAPVMCQVPATVTKTYTAANPDPRPIDLSTFPSGVETLHGISSHVYHASWKSNANSFSGGANRSRRAETSRCHV
ncbi:hypothetical protein HPB50_008210 [Hyalomma asiaticum]|uniref:Uncharacterized protein n=1 Tax=Hyalomma asiaticum TaxID=266040 RepID=A0ACB7TCY9_HYAAI|nr:hypothetical protein HPB50_008210 [Hyalomma asiaticum]